MSAREAKEAEEAKADRGKGNRGKSSLLPFSSLQFRPVCCQETVSSFAIESLAAASVRPVVRPKGHKKEKK